jgi:hypothetical protein
VNIASQLGVVARPGAGECILAQSFIYSPSNSLLQLRIVRRKQPLST